MASALEITKKKLLLISNFPYFHVLYMEIINKNIFSFYYAHLVYRMWTVFGYMISKIFSFPFWSKYGLGIYPYNNVFFDRSSLF